MKHSTSFAMKCTKKIDVSWCRMMKGRCGNDPSSLVNCNRSLTVPSNGQRYACDFYLNNNYSTKPGCRPYRNKGSPGILSGPPPVFAAGCKATL